MTGSQTSKPGFNAVGARIAIVAARFNSALVDRLIEGASRAFRAHGGAADSLLVTRVPGAFELPLAALKFAACGEYQAVIALGCVIRGDTPHFDFVAGECARGLMDAGLATGVPVIFGVLTTESQAQAEERASLTRMNKGGESMEAALEMIELLTPFVAEGAAGEAGQAPSPSPGKQIMARAMGINPASARRAVARKLAMQALYRWQINSSPWQDVLSEFASDEDMHKADRGYFKKLVTDICGDSGALDSALAAWMDRKPTDLDPVERAVLWVGAQELKAAPDVPYRVVINEAVGLAKRFGATDSHKFVNAVLDAAARELRPHEH